MSIAASLLIGLALDTLIGWPDPLYRKIGHPVTWVGALITALDKQFNSDGRGGKALGALTWLVVVGACVLTALLVAAMLTSGWLGTVLTGVLIWPWLAARSLYTHVANVMRPLARSDLGGARAAVSMIVGRDPAQLDGPAIARAGIESLAENASDGVIAPLFWGLVFGLPGIAGYKAINTLDSMIGYRNARYENFGWASARLDDVANLIPSRLTGLLIAIASLAPRSALRVMMRDASAHRSPNAGWPESAMAAAIGCRLSGPRQYGTRVSDEPWLNGDAPDPGPTHMRAALSEFRRAIALAAFGLAILTLI